MPPSASPAVTMILSTADPAVLERAGWVLLHFLWQGSALAALLAVALHALRHRPPTARYRAACLALAALVAAPVATYGVLAATAGTTPAATANLPSADPTSPRLDGVSSSSAAASARSAAGRPGTTYLGPAAAGESTSPADDANRGRAATGAGPGTAVADGVGRATSPWAWVVGGWAVGVAALSAWRVGGWLHLRRLLRRTTPVGGPWPDRVRAAADRLGVRRPVRLAEAAWAAGPAVVGLLRPVILVPAAALAGLTPGQLEAILAHELAHVRRRDYLVNLLQAAAETALFYHPAVWWVSARIREEREHCCDDLAVAATAAGVDREGCGDGSAGRTSAAAAATYAEALAAAEAIRHAGGTGSLPGYLALAATGGGREGGPLVRRVRRVLGVRPPPRRRVGPRPVAAAVAALACAAVPLVVARAADKEQPATGTPATGTPATGVAATRPAGQDRPTGAVTITGQGGRGGVTVTDGAYVVTGDVVTFVRDAGGPTTAPAGHPVAGDELAAVARPPGPEDLVAKPVDYVVARNDLLSISISDLSGPGTTTVKTVRVAEASGTVSLPYLGKLSAAGMTEADLEEAIVKAYEKAKIVQHAQVAVQVVEMRGRTFSVLGGVPQPGQYAIAEADFRLLDALVIARADVTTLDTVYVIRGTAAAAAEADRLRREAKDREAKAGAGDEEVAKLRRAADAAAAAAKPRVVVVPARGLAAGDRSLNVVVRPGDAVIARGGASQAPARLVVDADDKLTFRGERTTWAALPDRLGAVPAAERARAVLVVVPAGDQMTLRQLNEAGQRATALAKEYGFKDVQVSTTPTAPPPSSPPTAPATKPF